MNDAIDYLLEPIKLGSLTVRNRIALAPMGIHMISADGSVNERFTKYHTQYAQGGVGVVIPEGRILALGCYDKIRERTTPEFVVGYRTLPFRRKSNAK